MCKQYVTEMSGIERLVANVPVDHTSSARVAEKIGIKLEKTFENPKKRGTATYLYVLD